jgi:glycosyltransferase involved in cell wall biosynthesis
MLTIAIAIPTYNRLEYLKRLIQTIEDQEIPENLKVFCVVSNSSSTDGTTEYLIKKHTNQSQKKSLEFLIKNPEVGGDQNEVAYKENWRKAINYVPDCAEWTWLIGDDDFLTANNVLINLVRFITIAKEKNLSFMHLCQARRSTKTNSAQYGTLFELCNNIGFHEILGWMSSIFIKTEIIKDAFESTLFLETLSAYPHSSAILNKAHNLNAAFIDSSWVDPQDPDQTEDTKKRWQAAKIGESYFYIIDDLIYMKERGSLPYKLNYLFFRYHTYSLRDRYTIFIMAELSQQHSLTERAFEHWRRVEKIGFFLGKSEEIKDFQVWYELMSALIENCINTQTIRDNAFQRLVNTFSLLQSAQYPFTVLTQKE